MKLPKKAKKGKANLKKDKTTNVDTEVYKKWISDPESVKDICRPPRPVASSRHEAKGRRYHKVGISAYLCACVRVCSRGVGSNGGREGSHALLLYFLPGLVVCCIVCSASLLHLFRSMLSFSNGEYWHLCGYDFCKFAIEIWCALQGVPCQQASCVSARLRAVMRSSRPPIAARGEGDANSCGAVVYSWQGRASWSKPSCASHSKPTWVSCFARPRTHESACSLAPCASWPAGRISESCWTPSARRMGACSVMLNPHRLRA